MFIGKTSLKGLARATRVAFRPPVIRSGTVFRPIHQSLRTMMILPGSGIPQFHFDNLNRHDLHNKLRKKSNDKTTMVPLKRVVDEMRDILTYGDRLVKGTWKTSLKRGIDELYAAANGLTLHRLTDEIQVPLRELQGTVNYAKLDGPALRILSDIVHEGGSRELQLLSPEQRSILIWQRLPTFDVRTALSYVSQGLTSDSAIDSALREGPINYVKPFHKAVIKHRSDLEEYVSTFESLIIGDKLRRAFCEAFPTIKKQGQIWLTGDECDTPIGFCSKDWACHTRLKSQIPTKKDAVGILRSSGLLRSPDHVLDEGPSTLTCLVAVPEDEEPSFRLLTMRYPKWWDDGDPLDTKAIFAKPVVSSIMGKEKEEGVSKSARETTAMDKDEAAAQRESAKKTDVELTVPHLTREKGEMILVKLNGFGSKKGGHITGKWTPTKPPSTSSKDGTEDCYSGKPLFTKTVQISIDDQSDTGTEHPKTDNDKAVEA